MKLSIVIPVHESAEWLAELVFQIRHVLSGCLHEILLVDDASQDASWRQIELLCRDASVRGVRLPGRVGQQRALFKGIELAKGEIIVTMDDDFEHPPEVIPQMVHRLQEGYDVVYATDTRKNGRSLLLRAMSEFTKTLVGRSVGRYLRFSGFRAIRGTLREKLLKSHPQDSLEVALHPVVQKATSIPIRYGRSRRVRTRHGFGYLVRHAWTLVRRLHGIDRPSEQQAEHDQTAQDQISPHE